MKADHAQVNRLLKTARGQIDGILKMVEEDRYCLDVSSQIMAAQSILKKANRMVLRAHMDCCVREAVASGYGRGRYIRDVKENTPYRDDILLLYDWGVAGGVDKKGSFQPGGRISRGEAAAMVARAAAKCGLANDLDANAARDVLAQFGDYTQIADYARVPMAFCYQQGILDDSALNVEPNKVITRAEIAEMLYNMLSAAKRL